MRCCSAQDLFGDPKENRTEYRPRVRPRKIVMPVDPEDLHSLRREGGADHEYLVRSASTRKHARNIGVVKLGELPEEQTFSDLFGAVLENVKKRGKLSVNNSLDQKNNNNPGRISEEANSAFLDLSLEEPEQQQTPKKDQQLETTTTKPDETKIVSSTSYQLWDALETIQLNSAHCGGLGMLTSSGHSLIQLEVTSYIFKKYPRLRSRHVDSLVHSVIGIQPMLRLGTEIGLVSLTKMETDASLWKELANMHQREQVILKLYRLHQFRLEVGETSRYTWFYRRKLKHLKKMFALFPTDASTLLPRVEWIRNATLAFVGWLEMSEGEEVAKRFVQNTICSLFDVEEEHKNGNITDGDGDGVGDIHKEHPLNVRQEREAHKKTTTSSVEGAEPFSEPIEEYNVKMLSHLANPRVVSAINPDNALKEAQIILNYSPFIPRETLVLTSAEEEVGIIVNDKNRRQVVKFDIKIRTRTTPILEGKSLAMRGYNTTDEDQEFYTPKVFEADFVCFDREQTERMNGDYNEAIIVLGTGIGLTEQDAMQNCCLNFVRRYYFSE